MSNKKDTSSPNVEPFEELEEAMDKEPLNANKPPYQVCEVVCMQNVVTIRLKDPEEAIRFAMKMLEEKV